DSLLSFQEWKDSILGYCGNLGLKMSEWIQMGRHEKAREVAALLLESVGKARQSYLGAAAYNVKYAKNEAQAKMFSELYDEHLRRLNAHAERLTKRIAKIDAEQYPLLREEID